MTLLKLLAVLDIFKQINKAGEKEVTVWDEYKQAWVPVAKVEQEDGQLRLLPEAGYTPPQVQACPQQTPTTAVR